MGRQPAAKICREGEWSAAVVAARLRIDRRRLTYLAESTVRFNQSLGRGNHVCFTSTEVLGLAIADKLNAEGVRMPRVRATLKYLLADSANADNAGWFFTDGHGVLVKLRQGELVDVSKGGQLVMSIALGAEVSRWRRVVAAAPRRDGAKATARTFRSSRRVANRLTGQRANPTLRSSAGG